MYFSFLYVVASKTSICVTCTTYVGRELLTEIIYKNNPVLVYKIHLIYPILAWKIYIEITTFLNWRCMLMSIKKQGPTYVYLTELRIDWNNTTPRFDLKFEKKPEWNALERSLVDMICFQLPRQIYDMRYVNLMSLFYHMVSISYAQ